MNEQASKPVQLSFRGWPERLWFCWVTVIVPAAFAGTFLADSEPFLPIWKSPDLGVWPVLLLGRGPSLGFLPLAVPVMAVCLGIVVYPGPWTKAPPVRVVLSLGAVLAVQYAFLLWSALLLESWTEWYEVSIVVIALAIIEALSVAISFTGRWLWRRLGGRKFWLGVSALLGLAVTLRVYDHMASHGFRTDELFHVLETVWATLFIISLLAGPVWCSHALIRLLLRPGGPGFPRPLAWLPVLAAYAVSWRWAVLEAMKAYETLPDSPPERWLCFVATAASHGPNWLVGRGPITPQLRRLKAFELLLRAVAPRTHRRLRRLYDRWGPKMAAMIRTPARSACAWVALKPVEWVAVLFVVVIATGRIR